MSTFDEELEGILIGLEVFEDGGKLREDPRAINRTEAHRQVKALIKKHQPEKLVRPSKHGKLYCPHCAKESMIHFPTVGDDYNQALADSDKAYGIEDKRLPVEWRHSDED